MAGKWDDALMARVAAYLREAGLEPLGWAAQAHTTQQVMEVQPQEGIDMAIALGRPVITNPAASYWAFMRQLGRFSRRPGFGRLIDSLRP